MTPAQEAALDRMYTRMVEIMTDEPDLSMQECMVMSAEIELMLHGVPDTPAPLSILRDLSAIDREDGS